MKQPTSSVEAEAGLDDAGTRYQRDVRRRRRTGAGLLVASVALIGGLIWLGWPDTGDNTSVEVRGAGPDETINTDRTPSSMTGTTDDGLRVTVSVDDTIVPVGEAIAIDMAITNESDTTIRGAWNKSIECSNLPGELLTPDGDRLPESPLEPGWRPPDPIAPSIIGAGATTPLSRPTGEFALVGTFCTTELPLQPLEAGESRQMTGSWIAAFSPGTLPNNGRLVLRVTVTTTTAAGSVGDPTLIEVPITVTGEGRLPTPTEAQLEELLGDPGVTSILDGLAPDSLSDTYAVGLSQMGRLWVLMIEGDGGGTGTIWFDTLGELVDSNRSQYGAALEIPPEAQLCPGGCGSAGTPPTSESPPTTDHATSGPD